MGFLNVLKKVGNVGKGIISGGSKLLGGFGGLLGVTPPRIPGLSGAMGNFDQILSGLGPLMQGIGAFTGGEQSAEDEGERLGRIQKAFLRTAYPGTNPWEQLGTGQGGAQGSVTERGQDIEDRMNKRTISAQREIATQSALAQLGPTVLQEYPEAAGEYVELIKNKGQSAGPNLSNSMGQKRLALDTKIRNLDIAVKQSNLKLADYDARTRRWMAQLSSGKLDLDAFRANVEAEFKDEEVANMTIRAMTDIYNATAGNPMKFLFTLGQSISEQHGGDTLLGRMLREVETRDVRLHRRFRPSTPTSAPGRPVLQGP